MLLKRLQLQGFKTFANKTEFIFDEGLTAIVGPNGSGKSNVADAIKWVLGEQSASELRGKRTMDMIFAGSATRPRSGMASAFLTLDNTAGWLPIDYAEVEIGRRASRNGDSDYFLNGSKIRLKDIRELLATSGLAQRTYTMIGQGMVDRALSLKSDERRALFEEAAGISHYKDRRSEALRRLRETQRNIERVNDVLEELKPRLRSLKRQANRAENYGQVNVDLRHLLRIWYGYQWDAVKGQLRVARSNAAGTEQQWKASRRQLLGYQEQTETLRQQIGKQRNQIAMKEEERDILRTELEQVRRQVAILTERQALITQQFGEINKEVPELEAQQTKAQQELDEATAALQTIQSDLNRDRQTLAQFETSFQAQQQAITRSQQLVGALEKKQAESQRELSQAEGQLTQMRERLAELDKVIFASADPKTAAKLTALDDEIAALATQRKQLQKERGERVQERQTLMRDLKQWRRDLHEVDKGANKLAQEVARLEAKADLLNELRQKTDVQGGAKVVGRFGTLIKIPAAHQTALEAALNARLETLIVANEGDLWRLLADNADDPLIAVAQNRLQTAAITENVTKNVTEMLQVTSALSVVTYAPKDADLVALLLAPIVLVDDVQTAAQVAQQLPLGMMAVSADGVICHAGGLVERPQSSSTILQQQREYEGALTAVAAQREAAIVARDGAAALRGRIETQQTAIDKVIEQERQAQRDEQAVNQKVSDAQRERDRTQQQVAFAERQQVDHNETVKRLRGRIATLENGMDVRHTSVNDVVARLNEARVALEAMPIAEAKQQRTTLQQQIGATKTIVDGRRAVVDSRRATLGQLENRLTRQRQRLQTIERQQQEINLEAEQKRLTELQTRMTLLDQELAPIRASRKEIQGKLSDIETDVAIHQKAAHKHEEAYTEARLTLSDRENHITNLRERIQTDLGVVELAYDDEDASQPPLEIEGVVEKLEKVDVLPDGIEESIRKLRGQLQRMGAINPDAPQEYAETQERFDFMSVQIDDLLKTETQLRGVIAELDELTSREFASTVDRVNSVFGEMFTQLFGGGSGELSLTDPDDLTVTGVDIMTRLPRKRAQGLALLSGGERSLTAAALIFALLKVTPPPFCVMDEVDAALDEANINRFRDALRDLSLKTQFIVITHNRGTVQAANTIYGISMGGDGVSQVISIKPEDYVNSEEF